jgi:hypothetical protein
MSGRICPQCDREITVELVTFDGLEAAVDTAGAEFPDADQTDFERAAVSATVRLSCRCSYHDIEAEGSVSAFDFMPDEWVYEEVADA